MYRYQNALQIWRSLKGSPARWSGARAGFMSTIGALLLRKDAPPQKGGLQTDGQLSSYGASRAPKFCTVPTIRKNAQSASPTPPDRGAGKDRAERIRQMAAR